MSRVTVTGAARRVAAGMLLLGALLLALPAGASAARVLERFAHGRVAAVSDPYLPAVADGPWGVPGVPAGVRGAPRVPGAPARRGRARAADATGPTVPQVLATLRDSGKIDSSTYTGDLGIWNDARSADAALHGTAGAELGAVITNAAQLAASGELSASRVPETFLTLSRNRQWWTSGTIPTPGERVEFGGSDIVWQYYRGQGLQLQVLGTFGKANALYTAGASHYTEMRALVDEMIPLAATRDGALAWEYLFHFENGTPPWTSAMSQATGIEALTRASAAATAQGDANSAADYLAVAHEALAILHRPPPTGVAVSTSRGTWYLLYSFDPGQLVLNGFLQTLVGLYDYAHASGDSDAQALFAAGDAEAQHTAPLYDTGAWSLYTPGQEDDLSYHELVTGFLHELCTRTAAAAYCTTAQHFDAYLTTSPVVALSTTTVQSGAPMPIAVTLSKTSHVTVTLTGAGGASATSTADLAYQTHAVTVPSLAPGAYSVAITATDLAGNVSHATGSVTVTPPPPSIVSLSLVPGRFRPAPAGAGMARGRGAGARLRVVLNQPESVTFTVSRRLRGRVRNGRCIVSGTGRSARRARSTRRSAGHAAACTLLRPVRGSLTVAGGAGPHAYRFTGRLGRGALAPGVDTLTATPAVGGKRGHPATLRFVVVR